MARTDPPTRLLAAPHTHPQRPPLHMSAAICPECGAETLDGEPPIHNRTCPAATHARGYRDGELREPRELSDRRLFEIVQECLSRWHAYPTIPGGLRHARNGTTALIEIERRLRDVRP
jgi:hypothetical protein